MFRNRFGFEVNPEALLLHLRDLGLN
jgi:hypothetical protein